jgi:hypothetical protein
MRSPFALKRFLMSQMSPLEMPLIKALMVLGLVYQESLVYIYAALGPRQLTVGPARTSR